MCSAGDVGDTGSFPGLGRPPGEEEMATHSSILAWRIPWTQEPGGLWSKGLQRVRHNWSDWAQAKLRMSAAAAAKSLQSCPTLYDPIDGSPPGSPIHGIFQARVLEWGAIAFSQNVGRAAQSLPETPGENQFPCLSPVSRDCLHFLAHGPLLHLQRQQCSFINHLPDFYLLPPPSIFYELL